MMDHSEIEQNQVVDRYLMGRLTPEETAAFEEHYLSCPACLEEISVAEGLQRGFRRLAAQQATAVARLGILAALSRLGRSRRWVLLAAVLVLLVAPASLLTRELLVERQIRGRLEERLAHAGRPRGNVPMYLLHQERGDPLAAPSIRFRLPSSAEPIVLALVVGAPQHATYRATLLHRGEAVWRGEDLELDGQLDALLVSVPATFLTSGDYQVRVEGWTGEGEPVAVARYSFRVVPAA